MFKSPEVAFFQGSHVAPKPPTKPAISPYAVERPIRFSPEAKFAANEKLVTECEQRKQQLEKVSPSGKRDLRWNLQNLRS